MVGAEAMSEFKFACPVCGQHLTADSSTSGGQIECPTCFRKIVVPQAPRSDETKLILSAAQVSRPRPAPADTPTQLGPLRSSSHGSSWLPMVALLLLLGAATAALFVFRGRILTAFHPRPTTGTNAPEPQVNIPVALNTNYPVPANITWTLDLTNAVVPDATAAGRIHGSGFLCEKAYLQGGHLSLSQGKTWPWDMGLTVHLYARQGEELSGKTVQIPPDRLRAPRVILRWKDAQQQPATETINNGYALRVVFGQATNSHMPGNIYICLPDSDKSFVAGTFDAEITRLPPPSPGSPPPPRPKR